MRARSSVRYSHWSGPSLAIALSLTASAAFGQAAAQSTPEATGPIAITAPAEGDTVVGRQVAIGWEAPGLTIVPAAEAQEETDLHAHFIVDGAYEVVEGAPIPNPQCGVLHTAANPATLSNLAPGEHTVALVIANPGHIPVEGLERPTVTFTVEEDPDAVRITSPENCDEVAGPDVEIAWDAPGMSIVAAADAQDEDDRHAHFIIDGAYQVVEDAPIPTQDGVIHTAAYPATIEGLAPGLHTIQLVIANPGHVPVPDLARPTLTILAAGEEAATPVAGTPAAAAQSADAVEVVSYDIYFEPKEIAIPADTDVTFVLPNQGVTLHNFSIDDLGIDVDIDAGATQEVVVNAPAGTYEYYCNVPGHKPAGMVGTLTIE